MDREAGAAVPRHWRDLDRPQERRRKPAPRRHPGSLFRERHDPLFVIKWKDIYEFIEDAIDRCEDIANVVEGVALEYA